MPFIQGFSQLKLIENNISVNQALVLRAIFILINNNTTKTGEEIHKTLTVDDKVYYDINQWEIMDALPIVGYNKNKRNLYRDLKPLIEKGFIVKYPIKTKFLIRLEVDNLYKDASY